MLEDSIRAFIAIPEKSKNLVFGNVSDYLQQNDVYEIIEVHPDENGPRSRIIFFKEDIVPSIHVRDGTYFEDYPDYTVIEVNVGIGQELEAATESDFLATDEMQALIETTVDLYTGLSISPKVGFGEETYQSERSPITSESFPPEERRFLTWCDIFSPAEVETIGRETLLSAPAPRVETLADGSILLISKNPVDNTPPEAVSEHVGIQTITDYSDHVSRSEFYDE